MAPHSALCSPIPLRADWLPLLSSGYVSVNWKTDRPGDPSQMIQPLQIPARGLVFDALTAGPSTGELVMLLHGFPQTCAC
jgi:hypothetical protein